MITEVKNTTNTAAQEKASADTNSKSNANSVYNELE